MSVTITKVKDYEKPSFHTMSEDCRKSLTDHLQKYRDDWSIGENPKKTKSSIMQLPSFVSGCFTYLQAEALADWLHE